MRELVRVRGCAVQILVIHKINFDVAGRNQRRKCIGISSGDFLAGNNNNRCP